MVTKHLSHRIYNICIYLPIVCFLFISCEDFIGGDIAADPNAPAALPLELILPNVQISLADTYGKHHSIINCSYVQQVEPVARGFGFEFLARFQIDEAWDAHYDALREINTMQNEAQNQGYNHMLGMVNVLEAFTIMMGTDVWGDMPYTEAAQGLDFQNPRYDSQSLIYSSIHQLLDEAILLFDGPAGNFVPGINDFIYGGDIDKWRMAAHGLKARAYLHYGDYSNALVQARLSFKNRMDNMSITYPDEIYPGPWYSYNIERTGDHEFHPNFKSLMQSFNDTDRLSVLDVVFTSNHPYLVADFKQDLLSYREIQFIIAETGIEMGAPAAEIRNAYLSAIDASFQELGFDSGGTEYSTYVSQPSVDPGLGNITINNVLIQKHIGLFVQPESYSDWRRRNIPVLVPPTGAAIPVRWNYSRNEYLYNTSAPPESEVDIYSDNVDWDN